MLSGVKNPKVVEEAFRSGEFKIKSLKAAKDKADMLLEVGKYYPGYTRRSFVNAFLHVLGKKEFVFEEFLHKLSRQVTKLVDCATTEQYKVLIEDIYNNYRGEKVNLRL